ncbi:type I-F CRISPR-associated endoribonuclease Cas6/Csy4 [Photobacterium damselae]|uniref:type I-F CRISPR-associated endoribonuclease Cas6/Csy4 n=1 Tax=Photobacterium damselae TaxID=38293 RepID=UPI002543FB0B|nr:type I-F CRISPR-associated endoribonuclease Cas6/Csy4 [Photobacterium damselae]WIH21073.1 type I-F CRISPR-associated endoribonuclease Cas6/Csy4 [Photobacterium damselae]
MDYYLDIQVEPDLEITAPALLNNLFAKFHRAMSQCCIGRIAVSFPSYNKSLGETLRLHGTQADLDELMALPWLKGLRDYTKVSAILPIPHDIAGYRTVHRVQKKSPHNLRKRAVAKGRMTEQEALTKIPDALQERLALPFIQMQSLSNKQVMRVYVALGEIQSEPVLGEFSSYGMSRTSTIPWF